MTNIRCGGILTDKTICPLAPKCKLFDPNGEFMMHTPGYYVRKEFRCNLKMLRDE